MSLSDCLIPNQLPVTVCGLFGSACEMITYDDCLN